MRYLTLGQVLELHRRLAERFGGSAGIRDMGSLESALAQPRMTFGGEDLYPTIVEKAAALCFSLVGNHPFVDGNKRVGHAAMEVFLLMNGHEIDAPVDQQEAVILRLAEGEMERNELSGWLGAHIIESIER